MFKTTGLLKYLRKPRFSMRYEKQGHCFACGSYSSFRKEEVINRNLAEEWGISAKMKNFFDLRESLKCEKCQSNLRSRDIAKTLVYFYGKKENSLNELIMKNRLSHLKIAEINSCGNLHQFLKQLKQLAYSEYCTENKGIRSEDLQRLSYKDNEFDLVLTSDVLEHIPDINKAMSEIYRILKPSGLHIFTVPVILSRNTVTRIAIEEGAKKKVLPDSFHGAGETYNIVYRELGGDFIELLKRKGFNTYLYFYNIIRDDYSMVFVCRKL